MVYNLKELFRYLDRNQNFKSANPFSATKFNLTSIKSDIRKFNGVNSNPHPDPAHIESDWFWGNFFERADSCKFLKSNIKIWWEMLKKYIIVAKQSSKTFLIISKTGPLSPCKSATYSLEYRVQQTRGWQEHCRYWWRTQASPLDLLSPLVHVAIGLYVSYRVWTFHPQLVLCNQLSTNKNY